MTHPSHSQTRTVSQTRIEAERKTNCSEKHNLLCAFWISTRIAQKQNRQLYRCTFESLQVTNKQSNKTNYKLLKNQNHDVEIPYIAQTRQQLQ